MKLSKLYKKNEDFAVSNLPLFYFMVLTRKFWPLKPYLKLYYRLRLGKKLDLKKPQLFTEKLNWLKVYDRNPDYWRYADKYEVKKLVTEKLGGGIFDSTVGRLG